VKKRPEDIRFELDHMVIKLGKYLRILGYDAEWNLQLRTHELIVKANREGRVFLTRNRSLEGRYPPAHQCVVLVQEDPAEQLRVIVSKLDLDSRGGLFSKCIRCNVRLENVPDKEEVRSRVHPNVLEQHEHFTLCPNCGTVFWHGSHVRNTCRKLGMEMP
jgi:uncharacterized protein with PIN domain